MSAPGPPSSPRETVRPDRKQRGKIDERRLHSGFILIKVIHARP
jgi:hypothetical protein